MLNPDPMVSVDDIRKNLQLIIDFTKDKSYESFVGDIMLQYAVIRCFEIIGEATKRVPDDLRNNYPDFPWRSMAAMRDKLIHGYDTVDPSVLWGTVKTDVPAVMDMIRGISQFC